MKIYLVGGAVRDKLLHLPVKEKDWVVVGATPAQLLSKGYRQVGKEFPVFLHPDTHEEYALARMERKINLGYQGFTFDTSPDVTLEEDLLRRDLTINAIAEDEAGHLIDPYHGKDDLENRILRHVSTAFTEDPVRILRIGRFYARFSHLGFRIAPETISLMQQMTQAGEVDALVPERVWKELERALTESHPEKFFEALTLSHALPILFPEITPHSTGMRALINASRLTPSAPIRLAALLHDLPDAAAITVFCNRYRLPNDYRELALLTQTHMQAAFDAHQASADAILALLHAADYFRRSIRFDAMLVAMTAISDARELPFDPHFLIHLAATTKETSAAFIQTLLKEGVQGDQFAKRLSAYRREIIHNLL